MSVEHNSPLSIPHSPLPKNVVKEKSFAFAVVIVKLSQQLSLVKKEYIISKQIIRSGTSIGAMVREAEHAESKADFAHKMSIALKEANETSYWLELLFHTDIIDKDSFDSTWTANEELIRLLVAIVKKARKNGESRMENEK